MLTGLFLNSPYDNSKVCMQIVQIKQSKSLLFSSYFGCAYIFGAPYTIKNIFKKFTLNGSIDWRFNEMSLFPSFDHWDIGNYKRYKVDFF